MDITDALKALTEEILASVDHLLFSEQERANRIAEALNVLTKDYWHVAKTMTGYFLVYKSKEPS